MRRLRHQSNTTALVARSGGAPNSQIVVLFEVPYNLKPTSQRCGSKQPGSSDVMGPELAHQSDFLTSPRSTTRRRSPTTSVVRVLRWGIIQSGRSQSCKTRTAAPETSGWRSITRRSVAGGPSIWDHNEYLGQAALGGGGGSKLDYRC